MTIFNKIIHAYINGNYLVEIYQDGTKIRYLNEEAYLPIFPESIDLKITNYCDNNCPMCHESSTQAGIHANLNHPFLDTLQKGCELAIGGGNPLSHPELIPFLKKMKSQGIICNITINQTHFKKQDKLINTLIKEKLINGIGISLINDNYIEENIKFSKQYPHTVIHVIAGIIDQNTLSKLYNQNIKLLVLGYKNFGRGIKYYNKEITNQINYLKENILEISKQFKLVSFDNLAVIQLDIESKITKEEYDKHYMGDDGEFTMYIDLVKEEFSISSTVTTRYPILDNIQDMFKTINKNIKR